MKTVASVLAVLFLCTAGQANAAPQFVAVDVFVNTVAPLAAWQFEFNDTNGAAKVVGIENGESEAFGNAPYYDSRAVNTGDAERIIVADYTLVERDKLPTGRVRIATLHLMTESDVTNNFDARLIVAATHGGKNIKAEISLEVSGGSQQ